MKHLILFFMLLSGADALAQEPVKGHTFLLNIHLVGRDAGSVVLMYSNIKEGHRDTGMLQNGRVSFRGTVNGANEALLFTKTGVQNVDDSTVVRFILEPGTMAIACNVNNMAGVKIEGSLSQQHKESWDKKKSSWSNARKAYDSLVDSLQKYKASDATVQVKLNELYTKIDSVRTQVRLQDLSYVRENPGSYFSAYLLTKHTHKMPVDSIEQYFILLSADVKESDLGQLVLREAYTLTDDWQFKEAYPLYDAKHTADLRRIKSLYDITLTDTAGNKVPLAKYKNSHLLIDFWGSWCIPCIENLPYLQQLEEEFKDKPIQFLSVSLDKDVGTWKKTMVKYKFSGMQLLDKEAIMQAYYKFLYVPRYVLISPDGRVVNGDAPHAQDPALKQLLDEVLVTKAQHDSE